MDKVFWKSKTFWVNTVGGLLTILSSTDVLPFIPPKYAAHVAGVTAVLNVILRSLKSQQGGALTMTQKPTDVVSTMGRSGTDG